MYVCMYLYTYICIYHHLIHFIMPAIMILGCLTRMPPLSPLPLKPTYKSLTTSSHLSLPCNSNSHHLSLSPSSPLVFFICFIDHYFNGGFWV